MPMTKEDYLKLALEEAGKAKALGEVPIGAVAVFQNSLIASAHNSPISSCDPSAHAEINVLRKAAKYLGAYRTPGLEIYVTLEPCLMCFGAMLHARVSSLTFGASDPKVGFSRAYSLVAEDGFFNHKIEVISGVLEEECSLMLKNFFRNKRCK